MQPLIDSLFALLLAQPDAGLARPAPLAPASRDIILHSSVETWQRALDELAPHKVFPLLSYRLREHDLLGAVPATGLATIKEMHDEVRARNAVLMLTLARILRLTADHGESVLLLKGILFADSYYPDFSTRPMSDIDVLAVRGRDTVLFSLLQEAGFRPSLHHTVQDHSITFMNREGVFLDAHRTLPLLDSVPWHRVWRQTELKRIRGVPVLTLDPNALVAHLVTHMHGHAPEIGFVLLWIVDLVFVLRRHASELDFKRVRKLMQSDGAWALLLRLTHLLESVGEPVAAELSRAARMVPALTIAGALRQRRITPWGLPNALGWVRLAAHQLGLHRSERPLPCLPDLVLWPLDELAECVAPPLARVSQR